MPDEPVSTTVTPEAGEGAADISVTTIGVDAPVAPVETPTEFDIGDYVDKDGNFKQGWKEALIPQDLWKDGFWNSGFKDIKGLMKIAANQAKVIGKKGVMPLTDKSTPSEIEEYRRGMGIPVEYKYIQPKDIELLDMSPEAVKDDFAELNKAHLSQKQFDTVMGLYTKKIQMLQNHANEQMEQAEQEAERIIREDAGVNYDSDLHLANRMIEENTQGWPDEKKTKFLEAINEPSVKPYAIPFLKQIASKFVEHKIITDAEVGGGLADLEAQINTEKAVPSYMNANDPQHKYQVEKVQRLFAQKAKREGRQS